MKNKLAVVLVGMQNSGKTTTMKYFDKEYSEDNKLKKYCKAGRRYLQFYKLKALYSYVFFVPASPTETKKSLKGRLKGWRPEMILIAEQIDKGESWNRYKETKDFLESEGYNVKELLIGDDAKEEVWKKWTNENFNEIMGQRAIEIGDIFREFIKEQT